MQEHDRSGAQRRERALDDRVGARVLPVAGIDVPQHGLETVRGHCGLERGVGAPVRRPEALRPHAADRLQQVGRTDDFGRPQRRVVAVVDVRPAMHADLVALVGRTLHDRLVARDQGAEPVEGGVGVVAGEHVEQCAGDLARAVVERQGGHPGQLCQGGFYRTRNFTLTAPAADVSVSL